ncbi:MAG: hypothetical protein F4X44_13385 [Gammaproteobacteria bacterium]|nr:hypothetical protein [Gammaproteobacteria bacterium]MYD81590.1 hypothetical protein [Gammaproteobacteria bacterium]
MHTRGFPKFLVAVGAKLLNVKPLGLRATVQRPIGFLLFCIPLCQLSAWQDFIPIDDSCFEGDAFQHSDDFEKNCFGETDDRLTTCNEFLRSLEQNDAPTPQERFDMVQGHLWFGYEDQGETSRVHDRERTVAEFEALISEFPDNVGILYYLEMAMKATLSPYEARSVIMERIVELAPQCSTIRERIIREIEIPSDPSEARAESLARLDELMNHGYSHARTPFWKIRFASMHFEQSLETNDVGKALAIQNSVLSDLKPETLMLDTKNRGQSLEGLCADFGYRLGLADLCLKSVAIAISRDLELGNGVDPHVWHAARRFGMFLTEATWGWGSGCLYPFGLSPGSGQPSSKLKEHYPFSTERKEEYAARLRKLLDSVPMNQQTMKYFDAYWRVADESQKINKLQAMLESGHDLGDRESAQRWLRDLLGKSESNRD